MRGTCKGLEQQAGETLDSCKQNIKDHRGRSSEDDNATRDVSGRVLPREVSEKNYDFMRNWAGISFVSYWCKYRMTSTLWRGCSLWL